MTHTNTEQSDALRLAKWLEHRSMSGVRPNDIAASAELRRLHARVQELEASQAQRVQLDVATIAEIAESFEATDPTDSFWVEVCRAFERASVVCITQEKQG